jgi:hypothetical protein
MNDNLYKAVEHSLTEMDKPRLVLERVNGTIQVPPNSSTKDPNHTIPGQRNAMLEQWGHILRTPAHNYRQRNLFIHCWKHGHAGSQSPLSLPAPLPASVAMSEDDRPAAVPSSSEPCAPHPLSGHPALSCAPAQPSQAAVALQPVRGAPRRRPSWHMQMGVFSSSRPPHSPFLGRAVYRRTLHLTAFQSTPAQPFLGRCCPEPLSIAGHAAPGILGCHEHRHLPIW